MKMKEHPNLDNPSCCWGALVPSIKEGGSSWQKALLADDEAFVSALIWDTDTE